MILVDLEHVPPGALLARPVPNPERPSQCLLQPGSELSPRVVNRLVDMRVPMVWVKGEEDTSAFDQEAESRAVLADRVMARVGALLTTLRAQLRRAEQRGAREVKISELSGCIQALASEMSHAVDHEPAVLQMAWNGNDLAAHLTNTTYYSLLLATNVPKYIRGQRHTSSAELWEALGQIGTAAVLHDVGKLVHREGEGETASYDEPNELTYDRTDAAYQNHVKLGAQVLRDGLHSAVVYAIINHHQRFNGKGFPRRDGAGGYGNGMVGTHIHIFARIIALANVIDHLFHHDMRLSGPAQRLCDLLDLQEDRRFDPVLFSAAMRLIPPFPMGMQVTLSDGTPAVVVRNNVYEPCYPLVVPQQGENKLPDKGAAPINLSPDGDMTIAQVGGHDVRAYRYDVPVMEPDPLDYWALKDTLKKLPGVGAEPALA